MDIKKNMYIGLKKYISENNSFESKELLDNIKKNIINITNFEDIFKYPIENRVFNFIQALNWFYFICIIIKKIKENNDFLDNFNITFNIENAIVYLINIYSYKQLEFEDYLDLYNSDSD